MSLSDRRDYFAALSAVAATKAALLEDQLGRPSASSSSPTVCKWCRDSVSGRVAVIVSGQVSPDGDDVVETEDWAVAHWRCFRLSLKHPALTLEEIEDLSRPQPKIRQKAPRSKPAKK
jgi:hypothetical protein